MSRYISVADTAKLVRAALKHNFKARYPSTRFYVRSKSYSGGASIDVSWTDGPMAAEVDKVVSRFEGSTFDGMIDLKSPVRSMISKPDGTVEEVHFASDWVFTNRSPSAETKAAIEPVMRDYYGRGWDLLPDYERERCIWRYFVKSNVAAGTVILTVPESNMEPYDCDVRERANTLLSMKA